MDGDSHLVCLSLGSNIAPAENLKSAVELLSDQLSVLAVSRAWRTAAVGTSGPDFLNAAVLARTSQDADTLNKDVLRKIESRLGRVRSEDKYAPRTIDIDIVIYGDQIIDETIWTYAHIAQPVAELLPDLIEPLSSRSLDEIASSLVRRSGITPCPDMLECI